MKNKNKKKNIKKFLTEFTENIKRILIVITIILGFFSYCFVSYKFPLLWEEITKPHTITVLAVAEAKEVKKEVKEKEKKVFHVEHKKHLTLKEQEEVKKQIKKIAKEYNAERYTKLLLDIAFCESSYNPHAKSKNSSATGLYQFTKATWEEGLKRTGHEGEWTLEDREDIEKSTRMAIFFLSHGEKSRWNESSACRNNL